LPDAVLMSLNISGNGRRTGMRLARGSVFAAPPAKSVPVSITIWGGG